MPGGRLLCNGLYHDIGFFVNSPCCSSFIIYVIFHYRYKIYGDFLKVIKLTTEFSFVKVNETDVNNLKIYSQSLPCCSSFIIYVIFHYRYKIYGDFLKVIKLTTEFSFVKVNETDVNNLPLMHFVKNFSKQNEDIKRCLDDENLCKPDVDIFFGTDLEFLCYFTGESFYNLTQNLKQATEEYVAAFSVLTSNMKEFMNVWSELSDQFY